MARTRASRRDMLGWAVAVMLGVLLLVPSASTASEAPSEIRIGATLALSGRFTPMVGTFDRLCYSWAKQVNAAGGIYVKAYEKKLPVKFIIYDDKSEPAESAKFYERLVTVDKVHILLGPFSSHITKAAVTVADKYKIPMVMAEANDAKIFEERYQYSVNQIDLADTESYGYLEMLKAEGHVKSIAFIAEDTLHSTGALRGGVKRARELGLQVVLEEIAPPDTKDFTAIILKLKKADPDVVYLEAFPGFEIPFMKQAFELGLKPREFFNGHIVDAVLKALGPRAEGLAGVVYWAPGLPYPGGDLFEQVLKDAGIEWAKQMESSIHFQSFQVIQQAIEKTASLDPEQLNKVLHEARFATLAGEIVHSEHGLGNSRSYPVQVQGGEFKLIWPKELARSKHMYPSVK
ncbi:MAG: amino acid ABC transporter substrate-binding protein [Nitrospinae bacterium]|nr:amino acid ABC transporter substrate-binding protein [Nitrospinota bacterium]